MKNFMMLLVLVALLAPGTILAVEWEDELTAQGWVKLTAEELLRERPKNITQVGVGEHKGKYIYIDPSGLKLVFFFENTDCCNTRGTREYLEDMYCQTWERNGQTVCFPTHRSVWKKGDLRAVYSSYGNEIIIYTMKKGNIKNLVF